MNTIAANLGLTPADGGLRGFSACRPRQWMAFVAPEGRGFFATRRKMFCVSRWQRILR